MSRLDVIRKRLEGHRKAIVELEEELRQLEAKGEETPWYPEQFYLAYYVLAGMLLGAVAAWVTLGINVVGAYVLGMDPLKLLRVYATFLGGEATAASKDAVVLVLATGLHTFTGVICGTPIHVVCSRYFGKPTLVPRLVIGAALGVVMWLVNFYGVLWWLQPLVSGTNYIVETIPWWVALGSHVAFTVAMLIMQPLAVFNPGAYPGGTERSPRQSDAGATSS